VPLGRDACTPATAHDLPYQKAVGPRLTALGLATLAAGESSRSSRKTLARSSATVAAHLSSQAGVGRSRAQITSVATGRLLPRGMRSFAAAIALSPLR
jgi:hypothetical protein